MRNVNLPSTIQRLEGKVAIVTGAAGGIGIATAERLLAEGAAVLVADIDGEAVNALAKQLGPRAASIEFDAADVASVARMVETAIQRFGRLDILHNNAALTTKEAMAGDTTATEIDLELWDRIMAVNVRGYLAGCKYAIPHMIETGGGSIINTASDAGLAGDVARTAYGVSKGAIMTLTEYVATQFGKQGIRCNAIAPGVILTQAISRTVPELVPVLERHSLTPYLGAPEDIAAAVAFLASDDGRYITGATLRVDGGLLAHMPQYAEVQAAAQH